MANVFDESVESMREFALAEHRDRARRTHANGIRFVLHDNDQPVADVEPQMRKMLALAVNAASDPHVSKSGERCESGVVSRCNVCLLAGMARLALDITK